MSAADYPVMAQPAVFGQLSDGLLMEYQFTVVTGFKGQNQRFDAVKQLVSVIILPGLGQFRPFVLDDNLHVLAYEIFCLGFDRFGVRFQVTIDVVQGIGLSENVIIHLVVILPDRHRHKSQDQGEHHTNGAGEYLAELGMLGKKQRFAEPPHDPKGDER